MRTAAVTLNPQSRLLPVAATLLALLALLALPYAGLAGGDSPRVYGISYLDGSRTMISFLAGAEVDGSDYWAMAGVYKEYKFECFSVKDYLDRIYCVGPKLPEGMLAHITLFHSSSSEPILDTIHSMPTVPKPTPKPSSGMTVVDPPSLQLDEGPTEDPD